LAGLPDGISLVLHRLTMLVLARPANRDQTNRLRVAAQRECGLDVRVAEGANHGRAQPKGNRLQQHILSGVPRFHVHIAHTAFAVLYGRAPLKCRDRKYCSRLLKPILAPCGSCNGATAVTAGDQHESVR
jgi:hypothetical protein